MQITKKQQLNIIMIVIVVFTMIGFGFLVKQNVLKHNDVKGNSFSVNKRGYSQDLNRGNNLNKKNDNGNIKPECSGWYGSERYKSENTLHKISEIENIKENDHHYYHFEDSAIDFYLPSGWKIEKESSNSKKGYRVNYGENLYISIYIEKTINFINDYLMCLSRCFNDAKPTDLFSWKSFYCSENYSEENLNMIKSGDYVNYLSTGSLPPGGTGSFIYSKIYNDYTVSLVYSSEDYQFSSKAEFITNNHAWQDMTKEEKEFIENERESFKKELYKIIKTVKIK